MPVGSRSNSGVDPDRYGVARTQVYNRIKALGVKTIKCNQKAYV